MSSSKKYMAASVPRFLRQTKLGYIPLKCIIGSRITRGAEGANLIFDIIMLPMHEFQRMKTNIGLQHIIAPTLNYGSSFSPSFVLTDTKQITISAEEVDPEGFARKYFMAEFGIAKCNEEAVGFSKVAEECTIVNATIVG